MIKHFWANTLLNLNEGVEMHSDQLLIVGIMHSVYKQNEVIINMKYNGIC